MNIAVLTSGGDAPGMNGAIRSIVKGGRARGHRVLGVRRGYEGLLDGDLVELSLSDVDGISRFGGTLLGSARSAEFPTESGQKKAAAQLAQAKVDALVVIGGNGSLTGAHVLGTHTDVTIVGLPASIDNDIGHTRLAIGVDTAVNTIVEACDRISDTARAHRRAFVVEVMGRDCGYLAMRAGIAADADAILFREAAESDDAVIERLRELLVRSFSGERGKQRVLIVKSEGMRIPTQTLVDRLQGHLTTDVPGVGIRATILGHVVRGGSPSALDRLIAQRLAFGAVLAIEQGVSDVMLAWEPRGVGEKTIDPSVSRVPLADVLAETRLMLDGNSDSMAQRLALLAKAEGILAL